MKILLTTTLVAGLCYAPITLAAYSSNDNPEQLKYFLNHIDRNGTQEQRLAETNLRAVQDVFALHYNKSLREKRTTSYCLPPEKQNFYFMFEPTFFKDLILEVYEKEPESFKGSGMNKPISAIALYGLEVKYPCTDEWFKLQGWDYNLR